MIKEEVVTERRYRSMNTFVYRILLEVSKEHSLTRAAEHLHITPSAVSHAISTYENELGFPVFIRRKNEVQLTKEGAQILRIAQGILNYEDALSQTVSEINGIEKGTVVLGAFTSIHRNWTADIISSFRVQYPDIDVVVYESNYAAILSNLQSGDYDLGFTTQPSQTLFSTKIFSDPWMCICPASLQPETDGRITVGELDWSRLIVPNASYNDEIVAFLKKHRIKTEPRFFIDDAESVYALVEKGLGFALFPELMLKRAPDSVRIIPLYPDESRSIYLSSAKHNDMSPATKKLFDHIVEYTAKLPSLTI